MGCIVGLLDRSGIGVILGDQTVLVFETVPADYRRCGHIVTRATFVYRRLMAFQTHHVSQSARIVLMLLVNVDKAIPVSVIGER